MSLVVLVLATLVIAAGLALTGRHHWLKILLPPLALGPLTYILLGFLLEPLRPPGRIGFYSLPLHYRHLWLNMAFWTVLWGGFSYWFWRRR